MGDEKKDSFSKRARRAVNRWLSQPSPFNMGVVGYNAHLAVKYGKYVDQARRDLDAMESEAMAKLSPRERAAKAAELGMTYAVNVCEKCGGTKVYDSTMPSCHCNLKPIEKVKDIADRMDAALDFRFAPSRKHAGGITGRLSSVEPEMQRMMYPSRMHRQGEKSKLVEVDFSALEERMLAIYTTTFFVIASDKNAALMVAQLILQGRVPNCYPNMADAIRQHNTVYPSYTDKKYKVFQAINTPYYAGGTHTHVVEVLD